MNKKVLVTGVAGFIGFHLISNLAEKNFDIVGIDNLNAYYDVNLKYARLKEIGINKENIEYNVKSTSSKCETITFIKLDILDKENITKLFKYEKFDYVIHLAAQAGVRYSLENPYSYIDNNISGFLNILEGCKLSGIKHLVFASSSSVYGNNRKMPLSTSDNVDHPISLYAASKKTNELMAHTYSHLFGIPCTGLRFFTVYGPWGRPDMALFIFTKNILQGLPIKVYNNGDMLRDFTYISDIVISIKKIITKIPDVSKENENPSSSLTAPYKIYNIGNSNPVNLMKFIEAIENSLDKKAIIEFLPLQAGDVKETFSEVEDLYKTIKFVPRTELETGIEHFVNWYNEVYTNISLIS